jgi:hypothetical protein
MEQPTCGVVTSKSGDDETICSSPASVLLSITNPDVPSQVTSVVLLCTTHDNTWELGQMMIVKGEDDIRIAIQNNIKIKPEEEIPDVTTTDERTTESDTLSPDRE